MTNNVIPFPDAPLQPNELLLDAIEEGLHGVVVLGLKVDGADYVGISNLSVSECVYLAELLKKRLLEDH